MSAPMNIAVPLSAVCLVYNIALTGFRLSTFELYKPFEAVATTVGLVGVNAAVHALQSVRGNDNAVALQFLLAVGSVVLVNMDRIKHVVGKRYRHMNLSGKVYIVTGSNTGIGYETAKALLLQGATVIMACRSLGRAQDARKALLVETGVPNSQAIVLQLDLCSLSSVRLFVEEFKQLGLPLHALINNAGVMMNDREITKDGFETTFQANHLSHFLLTNLLLPELEKTSGRVVTLSSSVHNLAKSFHFDDINAESGHYEMFHNYGQSKLANILFTKELSSRLQARGSRVTAYGVHPGCVRTEVTRHMNIVMRVGNAVCGPILATLQKTPEQGAYSSVHVATAPGLEAHAGELFFNCHPIPVSEAATDEEAARKLWAVSEKLCGL